MFSKSYETLRASIANALRQRRPLHTSLGLRTNIADGGAATHKPTPFQRRILLWTKTYKTDAEIPSRITVTKMKTSMDKFRIRVSIGMLAMTFFGAGIMAMIGRKERMEGKTVHKMVMQKREDDKSNH